MNRTASRAVEHVPDERLKDFCLAGGALLKHTVVHRAVPSVERSPLAQKSGRTALLALVLVISSLTGAYASALQWLRPGLPTWLPGGWSERSMRPAPVVQRSTRARPVRRARMP